MGKVLQMSIEKAKHVRWRLWGINQQRWDVYLAMQGLLGVGGGVPRAVGSQEMFLVWVVAWVEMEAIDCIFGAHSGCSVDKWSHLGLKRMFISWTEVMKLQARDRIAMAWEVTVRKEIDIIRRYLQIF